jgi:mono/diheme cytochrome c family protein
LATPRQAAAFDRDQRVRARVRQKGAMIRPRLFAFALLAVVASACATPPGAASGPSPQRGRALARDLCSGCHAIGRRGASPNSNAPPLRAVLSSYDERVLSQALQKGALMGHSDLPTVRLNARGAEDLIAYLKSIERPPGA